MHHSLPAPGSFVWIRQRRWRVDRASRSRHIVRLDVSRRSGQLTFLAPFDRPGPPNGNGRLRHVRFQHALGQLAGLAGRCHTRRTVLSAIGARIDLLPHQLEPALAVADGRRRLLIADEVGMGKTVQAGLVVAELVRKSPMARILILVPASIVEQWTEELRRRFATDVIPVTRLTLDDAARDEAFGNSPWFRAGVRLASLDFLKQPHVLQSLPLAPWDLLVIDEAHSACGESARHDAADALAGHSRRVLLLTATPHSGDEAAYARLRSLGALPGDARDLTMFRRTRHEAGIPSSRRVRWHRVHQTQAEHRLLDVLRDFEAIVLASDAGHTDAALLLLSVFRKRALSTAAALAATLRRRVAVLEASDPPPDWNQPELDFGDDADRWSATEARALGGNSGLPLHRERRWLGRLLALADSAARADSKIARVVALLTRSAEPVVVFTEFRQSLHEVERHIGRARRVAVLHGGLGPAERRDQLAAFLGGGSTVLLCTDVAGQGLNLHERARWVVSLELPWNPARLEQRIGRVDRIGQRRPVHFTLLVSPHPAESGLLSRLARRVLSARQTLGGDQLSAAMPDPGLLRTALVTDGDDPLASTPAALDPTCTHWVRPARRMAASIAHRRRLLATWRGPTPTSEGAWTVGRRQHPTTLVFVVPIQTDEGAIVELHPVAIAAPMLRTHDDLNIEVVAVAAQTARRSLRRRLTRLVPWWTQHQERQRQLDRALIDVMVDADDWSELQPGLFDRRALRAFDASARERQALERRLRSRRTDGDLHIGEPSLQTVILSPR